MHTAEFFSPRVKIGTRGPEVEGGLLYETICTLSHTQDALSISESPAPLIFASTMTKWCKFGAHSSHLKQ